MTPVLLELLQVILRTRAMTAEELAAATGRPESDIVADLDRLLALGFLVEVGGRRRVAPPEHALVAVARDRFDAAGAALADLRAQAELLPLDLQRDDPDHVPMGVRFGPDATIDVWHRFLDRDSPVDAYGVFPDEAVLAASFERLRFAAGSRLRLVIGPGAARTAEALGGPGIEWRLAANPPGWFVGADDDRCALPKPWGVAWPQQVGVLGDPVAAASVRTLFDEVWRTAHPIDAPTADWEPVLELLAQGLDEAAVAARLAVSDRTVRRHIADAKADLGATNLYALGRAYASSARAANSGTR